MAVTSRRMPTAFAQPLSTSVRGPRSNCGTPRRLPASSKRVSTTPTRHGRTPAAPVAHRRARSRSSVVLPQPGAESTSVERGSPAPSASSGSTGSAAPSTARLMRKLSEVTSVRRAGTPSCPTARPHTPTR